MAKRALPKDLVFHFVNAVVRMRDEVGSKQLKPLTGIAPTTSYTWQNTFEDTGGQQHHLPTRATLEKVLDHCKRTREEQPSELRSLFRRRDIRRLFDELIWELEEVLFPVADENFAGVRTWVGQTVDDRKNSVFPRVTAGMTPHLPRLDFINLYLSDPNAEQADYPRPVPPGQAFEHPSRRLFVMGMPGAGKSCLLTMATKEIVDGSWTLPVPARGGFPQPIPIILELPRFEVWLKTYERSPDHCSPLAEYAATVLDDHGLLPEVFRRLLGRGSLQFLLDTFDQVSDPAHVAKMILQLEDDVRRDETTPGDWIVVCSRPGVENHFSDPNERFARVELLPLNARQKWGLLGLQLDESMSWTAWEILRQLPDTLTSTPLITAVVAWLVGKGTIVPGARLSTVFESLVEHLIGEATDAALLSNGRNVDSVRGRAFDALSAVAIEYSHTKSLNQRTLLLASGSDYALDERQAEQARVVLYDTPVFVGPTESRCPIHQTLLEFGFARYLSHVETESIPRLLDYWSTNTSTLVPTFFVELADERVVEQLLCGADETGITERDYLAFAEVALRSPQAASSTRQQVIETLQELWHANRDEGFRGNGSNRHAVARCLGLCRQTVETHCRIIEHSDDEQERHTALDIVLAMESPWAVPFLRNNLDDDDNRIRFYATKFLGQHGDASDVDRFYDRWDREKDWDVHMIMLDAASQLPSDDLLRLLNKASYSECRDVVRWEARFVRAYHAGVDDVGSAVALGLRDHVTAIDRRQARDFAKAVMRALVGDDEEPRYEAGASIRKCADLESTLAVDLKKTFASELCNLLRDEAATSRCCLTWIVARCLRSLIIRIPNDSQSAYIDSIRRTLPLLGAAHVYARGEIARTLGDLVAGSAIRELCQAYSPQNDRYERLWIMHAIWEMRYTIPNEDMGIVYETVAEAAEQDDYNRALIYANRMKAVIEGRNGEASPNEHERRTSTD